MLQDKIELSDRQKDVLKEIGNICAGNAATALSQFLNRPVTMNVPRVHLVPVERVPDVVGGADKLVVTVVLQVLGDAPGILLLLFPQPDAQALSAILTGRDVGSVFTEFDQSAIKEAGSIVAAAYLTALSSFTHFGLIPSAPAIIIDMAGALVDYILIELAAVTECALVIDSEFIEQRHCVCGHFFLLPNPGSMEAILQAIGELHGK
ncbi:MAG: chemotaxis protein CheC [Candidatus Omnitrophica bacterium]|nr:chemotaxis protein CheC [Candidatus Omnitrophota bacterium]